MGKCEAGSVSLDRPLKLWSLILDSVRCGGGGFQRKKSGDRKGSEKLSELLKQPEWWEGDEDVRRKEESLQCLKNVARKLQVEETMLEGAVDVRRLTKDDPGARTTLALLGAIPPLVSLLDDGDLCFRSRIAAMYALLNLAIGNDANKAAIVKAGAVDNMVKLSESGESSVVEAAVANFLGLSALDSNKPIIGCSGAIPLLVEALKSNQAQAQQDSLRALYNLSIAPSNIAAMAGTDLIPFLFTKIGEMEMSERILSILGNLASASEGRKRISQVADAFPILMDVFNWIDSPICQEKSSYILMVMAHKSYTDRQTMIEAGIVSALLELTLLGSTLAQKRASRMLESFKGKGSASAPLSAYSAASDAEEGRMAMEMSQERMAVKQLVQQSLHSNMNRMVKRANLPHDFVPSQHLRSLTASSTSKSLPF
ncbi:hypothetical protein SASPL_153315 [Salvia splendens]|uniref:Vacuolar protein 8 n=1 Tax=Salvia splendens TaxID=180675 RepID=A0A8X8W4L2_SALSN|nr:U-box domain-containing protein 45-like [Salvia splendens]KAG6388117.1 hypothetical protein SASPL_153315 [Salvia splendens]